MEVSASEESHPSGHLGPVTESVDDLRPPHSAGPQAAASPGEGVQTTAADREEAQSVEDGLREALAREDEALDAEVQRLDRLERQRGVDEARIRAQVEQGPKSAVPAGGGTAQLFGQGFQSPSGQGQQSGFAAPLAQNSDSESKPVDGRAGWSLGVEAKANTPTGVESTPRARQTIQATIERIRELAQNQKLEGGKVNLSIRLDEVTQVRLTISSKADGGHELALLVADPKLRGELNRALPEIRNAAAELPFSITEVLIGPIEEDLEMRDTTQDDNGVTR